MPARKIKGLNAKHIMARQIAAMVAESLHKAGYELRIHNGLFWVMPDWSGSSLLNVIRAMGTSGEDTIHARHRDDNSRVGIVVLTYALKADCVADYSLELESALAPAFSLAREFRA